MIRFLGQTQYGGRRSFANSTLYRTTLLATTVIATVLLPLISAQRAVAASSDRPNVILIMTDDQGIGDFGATGNRVIETPHIDAMARESASLTTFYVSPVCSPTRACLMTGRYNYRTRCIDTYIGRSMMDPDETTVAEMLSAAGYATGIFGKWHLGDCYPLRAIDQGFEEALVHRGGGLAQPSEPRENANRYTDPILFHNGQQVQTSGYCTDIYFDAAMTFIESSQQAGRNFFVYVPTNAPHGPFHDVPAELLAHYQQKKEELGQLIVPRMAEQRRQAEIDRLARIAAMIANVDQNVGKLFAKLDELKITDNTLVLFLVDNGPNTMRYVGDLRGMKSNVHEGGVRSPLWAHWPARLKAGFASDQLSAHIDLTPTILAACGVDPPADVRFDGMNLLPTLEGKTASTIDRTIAIQSHRGDVPVRYHHFMIRDQRWKLLHASGFGREQFDGPPKFELYDLVDDPGESKNLIQEQPEVFQRLKAAYDAWFDDVSSTRPDNYAPPRIVIGTPHELETVLTRQDWRGGTWAADSTGFWELRVAEPARFDIRLEFDAKPLAGTAQLVVAGQEHQQAIDPEARQCEFTGLQLPAGETQLRAVLTHEGQSRGVYQVVITQR